MLGAPMIKVGLQPVGSAENDTRFQNRHRCFTIFMPTSDYSDVYQVQFDGVEAVSATRICIRRNYLTLVVVEGMAQGCGHHSEFITVTAALGDRLRRHELAENIQSSRDASIAAISQRRATISAVIDTAAVIWSMNWNGLRPHRCRFHWPQSWARASLTSTSSPPTTGPGFDAVLTMRW